MKKVLVALIVLIFFVSCSPNVVITTKAKGNILTNIKLKYKTVDSSRPVALKNGARISLDSDNFQTFFVDLTGTSDADHIQLLSEMNQGLKVYLIFADPKTNEVLKKVEIPKNGIEGYRQEDLVTYEYDRRGKLVGDKKVRKGPKTAYGDKEFSDTSLIPIDADLSIFTKRETEASLYVELDYSSYEMDKNRNTTEVTGEKLSENDNKVEVVHNIDYREVFFHSPRRSGPLTATIIKPDTAESVSSDDEFDMDDTDKEKKIKPDTSTSDDDLDLDI